MTNFDTLAGRHRANLFRAAFRIVRDVDEANDLVQETLTRAYSKLSDGDLNDRFESWTMVVVRNASLDWLRRKSVRDAYAAQPGNDTSPADPEALVLREDVAARLRVALGALPAHSQEAVDLFYFRGLLYREIAAELGVPIGTVKTWLRRSLVRLRALPEIQALAPTS